MNLFMLVIPFLLSSFMGGKEKKMDLFSTCILTTLFATIKAGEDGTQKEEKVLNISKWVGGIAGGGISLVHLYWMIGDNGLTWKVAATGIPPILIAGYVGTISTKWAAEQIMKGNPAKGKAVLKGIFYGAIDGSIILFSSYLPLFLTGYYLDIIHFNNLSGGFIPLKILGIVAIGSIAYGGSVGAIAGALSGPIISSYMEF